MHTALWQTTPAEWQVSQLEENEPTAPKSSKKNQRGLAVVKGTHKAKTGKYLLEGLEKDIKLGKVATQEKLTAAEAKAVKQSLKAFLDTVPIVEDGGREEGGDEEEGEDEEEELSGSENAQIPNTNSNPESGIDSECGTGSDAESE
ncbi:hypothetical protein BKA82DRAFT_10381 [Pisolithus tinctorius]|uniref:Uncharacterized protein n=1 Tax=Pisolithus tinctorius Marx 270 TaxID=870435 RepID=A0A0C3NWG7_PISTI|nr:hypothetical protein BKA82DRAFT_10381 [Pisolithus tinctorius]KIN99538.1 hypothetical protein M404DRAFT_10381 [Pisolithus tinctorius Marx 270]